MERLVAELKKSALDTLRIVLAEFDGRRYVGFRLYRHPEGIKQPFPIRGSFNLPVEAVPSLAYAVAELRRVLDADGVMPAQAHAAATGTRKALRRRPGTRRPGKWA